MNRIKLAIFMVFVSFGLIVSLLEVETAYPSEIRPAGGLAAPTGIEASDGDYANKVGIRWDTIRGATVYRIFRNTEGNSANAIEIGTTAANYFFDTSAVVTQQYHYWVRAESVDMTSSLSSSDLGVRASGMITQGLFTPLDPPSTPVGNELTAAKAYLGKTLFWDEQLSSTRTVACGTCHRPGAGGSDPRTLLDPSRSRNSGFDNILNTEDDVFGSRGVPKNNLNGSFTIDSFYGFAAQVTGRRAPSYLNSGYSPNGLFWDGRATDIFRDQLTNNVILPTGGSLESQSAGPPVNSTEMAHDGRNWSDIATRVQGVRPLALALNIPPALEAWIGGRTYPELFAEVFGSPGVTPSRISLAIASHERTLFSDNTPLDKWAAQIQPLSDQEQTGLDLFVSLQCNTCHDGALLTDHAFHNIGVRPTIEDIGREAVTLDPDDRGRFKTPSLRNVELHAPYMHNGRFETLDDVIEFYNRGGDFDAPNVDHGIIRPLNLTAQEKSDLVAFLKRPLTDLRVKNELPPFDRPQLFTESSREPVVTGAGRAGSGGFVPEITAISPPLVGNPNFTISVSKSVGGATAVLVVNDLDPGIGDSIPQSGAIARLTTNTQNSGSGNGWASLSIELPDTAAIVEQTFFARWYINDGGAENGFSVSRLVQFTVFGSPGAAPRFSISGRVLTPSGLGLRNAIVTLTNASGVPQRATTSSFGFYQFADIPSGSTVSLGISSKRYRFAARTITILNNSSDLNFIGLE